MQTSAKLLADYFSEELAKVKESFKTKTAILHCYDYSGNDHVGYSWYFLNKNMLQNVQ